MISDDVSVMYAVEAIVWGVLTLLYFILLSATFLALRFTPRRKVANAKLAMLSIAYLSVLINIPRTLDVSAVFGYLNYKTSTFLHNIVTALHLSMLDVFILSTARALYLQMQKPIPSFFTYALLGSNVFYLLSVVVINSLDIGGLDSRYQLNMLWGLRGIAFDTTLLLIIIINIILFVRLYRRLSRFIATVVAHAKTTAIAPSAGPALTREPTTGRETAPGLARAPTLMAPAAGAATGRSSPLGSPIRAKSITSPQFKALHVRDSPKTSPRGSPRQGLIRAPSTAGAPLVRVRTTVESLHPAKVAARALLTLDAMQLEPMTPPAFAASSPPAPDVALDLNLNTPDDTADDTTAMAAPTIRVHPANHSDELVLRVAPATPVANSPNHSSEHVALMGPDRRDSDSASRPASPSRATTPQQNPKLLQAPSSAALLEKERFMEKDNEREKEKEKERQRSAERQGTKHSTPVKVKIARQMTMPAQVSPKQTVARTMTIRPPGATGAMAAGSPTPLARTTTAWNRAPTISKAQASLSPGGSSDPPPAISSHEQRVKELRGAVRTLSILSACVFIIGVACIAVDLPDSLKSLLGSYADDEALYGPSPLSYGAMHSLFPFIQQLNIAIVCWYVWTPWVFRAKYRAEKGITFWEGLRHGGDQSKAASKYEASKKDSKLARANTIKSVMRVHTMSVQLTPAAVTFATAATVVAQVVRQGRDAGVTAGVVGGGHQSSPSLGSPPAANCTSPQACSPPGGSATPHTLNVSPLKHAWGSMGDAPKPLAVTEEDDENGTSEN